MRASSRVVVLGRGNVYGVSKPIRPALLAALGTALLLSACGTTGDKAAPSSPAPTPSPAPSSMSSPAPSSSAPPSAARQPQRVVVLDPGHNGGNAEHPEQINRKVPAGRGVTKPCNTTGTSTNGGYPEHAFTWDLAAKIRASLAAKGVRVVLTRDSDSGIGPCVNERAAVGNKAHADAVVSLHADGANSAKAHGFHVSYPSPPLNAEQGEPSARLAGSVRDAMRGDGLATSTYLGENGIYPRKDLGGLNLSTRPSVLVECGNMRNTSDSATFTSGAGRQHYADAITAGILTYLDKDD